MLLSLLLSFSSINEIESNSVKNYETINKIEKATNPCSENIDSETLKSIYENGNPLLMYYMLPVSFCFNDCYDDAPLCCQIVIIVK